MKLQQVVQQQVALTPQLQQALKVLQMSSLDLHSFINEALVENPFLGETEEESSPLDEEIPSALDTFDMDHDNIWQQEISTMDRDGWVIKAPEISLKEWIGRQISLSAFSMQERFIAVQLLSELDPAGYFRGCLILTAERLKTTPAHVSAVLEKLQTFEPSGIFARDLRECLLLQLEDLGLLTKAHLEVIKHLNCIAQGRFEKLVRLTGLGEGEIHRVLSDIRQTNPKPGLLWEGPAPQSRVPDVFLSRHEGQWKLELNTEIMPKIMANRAYYQGLKGRITNAHDKSFVAEKYSSAYGLVKALEQRYDTILRVCEEIVKQQDSFFLYGIHHLKPMILKDIASALQLHESTISRTTQQKYMATPLGLFELKYFFTSSLGGAGGISHSAETVKFRVKQMIEEENPDSPISDDDLRLELKKEGIDVARRTIAKYRDLLKIPSSHYRRRKNKARG